jgi:hypothetical protein
MHFVSDAHKGLSEIVRAIDLLAMQRAQNLQ